MENNSSTITQSFRDQKRIDSFIRNVKFLKIIEDAAQNYIKNFVKTKAPEEALAAIVVKIPLNYVDFLNNFTDLLHLAVEEPVQLVENTKYTVYGIIRDIVKQSSAGTDLKAHIDIDQVHVLLRFIGLPLQENLLFNPSSFSYRTGLSIIDGILRAYTEPESFVIQAVWYCGTGCTRNKLITESLQGPICSSCSRQMSEYSKLRVTQKVSFLRIQFTQSVKTPRIRNKIFHPIIVRLKAVEGLSTDDLDEMLEIDSIMLSQAMDALEKGDHDSQIASVSVSNNKNFCDAMPSLSDISDDTLELESAELEIVKIEEPEVLNFSTNEQMSFSISSIDEGETSFDKEFEKYLDISQCQLLGEKNSMLISTIDADNQSAATSTSLGRSLEFARNKNHEESESGGGTEASNSQVLSKRSNSSLYPIFSKSVSNLTKSSQRISDSIEAMDCLDLSYSKSSCSCSSGTNKETTIDLSEIVQSQQSSIQSNSNPPSVINIDDAYDPSLPTKTEQSEINVESAQNLNECQNINLTSDCSEIPTSVKQLYDIVKEQYSDFAFVFALSAQLCQERIPMGCFVNVKMSLLLSIASIGPNPNIAPIPIIVMGNDPYAANYLITSIADLADRFVGPVDDTKPPSSDRYCNRNWIEADPIQLAMGGVFYAGEWTCLKAQRSEKIFKDIETSRVAIERTTRIYPLQSAIWAHWRAMKYNSKDQQIFNKFVKIFGIPVYMDNANDEMLVDYTLKQASVQKFESTIDHLSIDSDEMRIFLAAISRRTVDFTPEANDILQKYFVASRTERPDCLTKQAFTILKQYAESFAKLSLRHEVIPIDAIGAIYLCEHFIHHLYGVGVDPPPMLESVSFVGYIDAYIAQFHDWVKGYISKISGN